MLNISKENTKKTKKDASQIVPINLGLCCINTILRAEKPPVFCSRTLTRKTFDVNKAQKLALDNVKDIKKLLLWNEAQTPPIRVLRISSDLFPHFTDPKVPSYSIQHCIPVFQEIGDFCRKHGHRILMHPGQFNQVASDKQQVFQSTSEELSYHADVLDYIGLDPKESVIIVHGGGTYGNKEEAKERWCVQFEKLPEKVRRRLVLENDEKSYGVADIIELCERLDIPMVYDCFHDECYQKLHPKEQHIEPDLFLPRVLKTWKGHRPIMHVSNQGAGRVGHHSDYITKVPDHILTIYEKYKVGIDLEVEAKMKEQAILQLYKILPKSALFALEFQ